jgi:hypothetical protein
LFGLTKKYQPSDEEPDADYGDPNETVKVLETRAPEVIRETSKVLSRLFDVTAARDFANCEAKSDVVLEDGTTILRSVPATYLLWMEKQLEDLHTFVDKLPILPADTSWEFDANQNCYKSPIVKTSRVVKIPYPLVLHPGDEKHPAQVVEKNRDKTIGHYETIKYSGALDAKTVAQMKDRVEKLQQAVKFAREKANTVEAPKHDIGNKVLGFIFGDILTV